MAVTITGSAGIPSGFSHGSTGILLLEKTITGGSGLSSGLLFGSNGALLKESSPGAGLPVVTIFIAGVDCTSLVPMNSIKRSATLSSRSTASFTVQDRTGAYQPAVRAEVAIYEGSTLFYSGSIESIEHQFILGTPAATQTAVRCTDYGVLCDRRVVYKLYGGDYAFLGPTVNDIVLNYLSGTGIWYLWGGDEWAPVTQLGDQTFNYCTATEAFNQLSAKVNGDWRVDYAKRLRFFPKATGYAAAPVSIVDDDSNLRPPVVIAKSRSKYANRVGVRNNIGRKLIWVDSYEAAADMVTFATTFPLDYKPTITIEGVEKIVLEQLGVPHTEDWDFDYSPGSFHVNWNNVKTWPTGTVEISYPCGLSYVHWAEDAAEIAANGIHEVVEEVKDIADDVSLDTYAAGLLARYKTLPVTLSFRTRVKGFEPGQLLTIVLTKPAIDETLLVESVDSQEQFLEGIPQFLHTVKASNSQWQQAGSPNAYFGALVERTKQPVDRASQTLRFNVAGTIKGVVNPGLVAGVAEGISTAQRDGVIGEIRVTFKSIEDGMPITSAISIDVYQNGVSVFGTTKLVLPAGSQSSAVQWIFASDPQPVAKGDQFTHEVLTADAAAKDGILEIHVIG